MKTVITIISLVLAGFAGSAQTQAFAGLTVANPCVAVYSEEEEGLIYEDPAKVTNEIIIQRIPEAGGVNVPVKIEFHKGHYTFFKGPGVVIPEDCHAYIEDQLTGQLFELATASSYAFNVARTIPNRFVMHIDKINKQVAKHHH